MRSSSRYIESFIYRKTSRQSLTVEKAVPLEFDLALLAGFDINTLDEERLRLITYARRYI